VRGFATARRSHLLSFGRRRTHESIAVGALVALTRDLM
jgi:hypothetical protein